MRKQAQKRIYHIDAAKLQALEEWIRIRSAQWNNRVDKMDNFLQTTKMGRD